MKKETIILLLIYLSGIAICLLFMIAITGCRTPYTPIKTGYGEGMVLPTIDTTGWQEKAERDVQIEFERYKRKKQ